MALFFIADSHFSDYDGKDSVIRIFRRPFKDSAAMNAAMIERWNTVVGSNDTVISLGDFSWCKEDFFKYSSQLNGKKVFLRGNHDFESTKEQAILPIMSGVVSSGIQFLLLHDPADIPAWWRGWVVHGHHHWMKNYPFVNTRRKNINVAAERVDYTPVPLEALVENMTKGWVETYEPGRATPEPRGEGIKISSREAQNTAPEPRA